MKKELSKCCEKPLINIDHYLNNVRVRGRSCTGCAQPTQISKKPKGTAPMGVSHGTEEFWEEEYYNRFSWVEDATRDESLKDFIRQVEQKAFERGRNSALYRSNK